MSSTSSGAGGAASVASRGRPGTPTWRRTTTRIRPRSRRTGDRDEAEARGWLAGLTDDDLAAPVTANGLEGFPLSTYLVHVVMHGVESFAAAAILLHRAGPSMGDVGFLDYVDTTGPPPGAPGR